MINSQVTIPPRTEMELRCRVTARNFGPLGIIESRPEDLPASTILNQPKNDGMVVARRLNISE